MSYSPISVRPRRRRELAKLLTGGTWTHDPITYERARDFGLRVRSYTPETMLLLMHLYPQPTRQPPSVAYVGLPYLSHRKDSRDGD